MADVFAKQEDHAAPADVSSAGRGDYIVSSRHIGQFSTHPIPKLQGAFEESIAETRHIAKSHSIELDAQTRRRDLLETPKYERLCGRKWRQRADEQYHPLWKLTAQMSFGVYLLVGGLAKSDTEVLKILQSHVDEVDGFLGRTAEDFSLIQLDVRTRLQYLSLPLRNLNCFDEMLSDRSFRLSIIDYNERIEHAVERFTIAVQDALKDIQKGGEAIGALWKYLLESANEYDPLPARMVAIYNAMLSNAEGWNDAFSELQQKGVALQDALGQLGLAIAEMQQRVGVASRKSVFSSIPAQRSNRLLRGRSLKERVFEGRPSATTCSSALSKPLPRAPDLPQSVSTTWPTERRRLAQKSVPNLRAAGRSAEQSPFQITSTAASVTEIAETETSKVFAPSIRRNLVTLSRSTSKPMEPQGQPVQRPSTAASRASRARSISLNHLKFLHKSTRHEGDSATTQADKPPMPHVSLRRETLKAQLLQFFKSDRVQDAWDIAARNENGVVEMNSGLQKDGPWSKFHTGSSKHNGAVRGTKTDVCAQSSNEDMAWVPKKDPETLNTYSLKPKPNTAPRFHLFPAQTSLPQELKTLKIKVTTNDGARTRKEVMQPVITALPSIHMRTAYVQQRSPAAHQ
ncbi:uncharacterized protein BP01DRAFT_363536 [Aspergillus saccharolyticus JOP 1030-1]|uniref:Uncharacterized protein n=1 Tax=Aspergillus saccharolyticus JOP 1030-1 TaxID=1450539 RepID=A0A318ZTU8_9EURO|nr:hypothetical protein BP01DRAFT_363536 [Aspergillus saccharolyticus JOP 1030-1]PYH47723.1 hypothetical protein BP01DRAFT_363536 [Aspergillus saccharolyticus JOP 1030-1]